MAFHLFREQKINDTKKADINKENDSNGMNNDNPDEIENNYLYGNNNIIYEKEKKDSDFGKDYHHVNAE